MTAMTPTSAASIGAPGAPGAEPKPHVTNVLAYVHLRNIHNSTGAGRVARQVTEHLALRDDVNLRILADARDRERILPLVQKPWTEYQYETFASDTSSQQARWFVLNNPRAESFWPEAEIVFCTAESYVPTKRAQLVVTAHDAAYFETGAHLQNMAFWKQKLKWTLLFQKLSRTVDMFHTVSEFSASRLGHFIPSIASRIRVVPNAVAPHFFTSVSSAGHQYLKKVGLADRPFILIPGGLHYRKNADLILAACPTLLSQFPNLIIAIVNHSNPEYAQRAIGLHANVKILGFVEESALHALYSAATVVWFPSRYEGFGMPVVEAMACGAPVVASDASSLPEIAGDAAILVDPSQPDAHVRALSSLLTDETSRKQFSEAGRNRASIFTWASSAAQLKHHFDTLL
jgi:glycosyltransferase involved in cell wall biosynthesis